MVAEPEDQSPLGGIAEYLRSLWVALIEVSGRVDRQPFLDPPRHLIAPEGLLSTEPVEVRLGNTHPILRQRTSLIGTDDGDGAHGLAGVHLTDEVISLEHPAHVVGEAERDRHRESLRHRHDDHGYGDHQRLEGVGEEECQVCTGEQLIVQGDGTGHQDGEVAGDDAGIERPVPASKLSAHEEEEECRRYHQ